METEESRKVHYNASIFGGVGCPAEPYSTCTLPETYTDFQI